MLDSIITSRIDIATFLILSASSLILGAATAWLNSRINNCSKSFTATLALMPFMVQVVIMLVNGNLGAGVAVAGAFGLVRFRSAPGSAKEIAAVFVSMAIGLACGAGFVGFAVVFGLVSCVLALVYTLVRLGESRREEKELRILIPESLDYTGVFDDIFKEFTTYSELVHVKTSNMGSLYKLTYHITMKAGAAEKAMLDEIRCRNGNLDVSFGRKAEQADAL